MQYSHIIIIMMDKIFSACTKFSDKYTNKSKSIQKIEQSLFLCNNETFNFSNTTFQYLHIILYLVLKRIIILYHACRHQTSTPHANKVQHF